jgi:hypothetical protein
MGRKKQALPIGVQERILNGEEVLVRSCSFCNSEILHKGKSKRWNVVLAIKKNHACSKCHVGVFTKEQTPWNKNQQTSEETKLKQSLAKQGKPVHSKEYKEWLSKNSQLVRTGEFSVVVQKVLKETGLSYPEYLHKNSSFKEYKQKVWHVTKQQPINLLQHSDKLRGLAGVPGAYQLDHIVSIKEGHEKNISPTIIGDIKNLQFLPWKENLQKKTK